MQHLESLAVLATAIAASGVENDEIISTSTGYDGPTVHLSGKAFRELFAGEKVVLRRNGGSDHAYATLHGIRWTAILSGAAVETEVTL
jgi:hypothetical protein